VSKSDAAGTLQLSALDMHELFGIASLPATPAAAAPDTRERLAERAAVLGAFTPADLLAGLEERPDAQAALDEVLRDCVVVTQGGSRRWLLSPGPRVATLERLGSHAAAVLNELGPDRADPLGGAVAAIVRGQLHPDATLTTDALRAHIAAGEWLRAWSAPAAGALPRWRSALKRRELLDPLQQIATDFVGREKDMAKLRDFVDVVPPESSFEGWSRWLHKLVLKRKAPLVVHGIGGIGKSTLMAQFILTHATVTSERGFPFAYLDFDRRFLDPNNPGTLLTEVIDQVGAQFEAIGARSDEFSRLLRGETERSRAEQRVRSSAGSFASQVADHGTVERIASQFASWMQAADLGDRPFLLVLDTFEEVQARGEEAVDAVFRWLEAMFQLPQLRVVISGRVPVDDRNVARQVALGNFDKRAALAFLSHAQLPGDVAEDIFDKVGGNPLSLRLCVLLARQRALGTVKKDDLETWLGKKDGAYIQGYLYTRLLRHIGDERVEKLAHPGLVLRRITKDLILQVLGPAVALPIASAATAAELYDALKKEVSLVTEEGDALIHRRDVRSVMLDMQRSDDPQRFADLNRRAVAYYAAHDPQSDVSLGEGAYHRLMLEEEPPYDVVAQLRRRDLLALGTALDELPPPARVAVRAMLGRGLAKQETPLLPDDAWTAYAYRRGMSLLAAGSPVEALDVLEERPTVARASVVRYSLAMAFFNTLRWPEAVEELVRPLDTDLERPFLGLTAAEKSELRVRPQIEGAFLLWYQGQARQAAEAFDGAWDRARVEGLPFLQLEAGLGSRLVQGTSAAGERDREFQRVLEAIGVRGWKQNLVTLRRLVFLGFAPPRLMPVAVSHLGVQLRSDLLVEHFLSRLGARLSDELLHWLKGAQGASADAASSETATMEKLAAAEVLKLLAEQPELPVAPYLRGRFAAWKIPARTALLTCYPSQGRLQGALRSMEYPALRDAAPSARTHRALAEAVVEYADTSGRFVPTLRWLVRQAPARAAGSEALLQALDLYAGQMDLDQSDRDDQA